MDASQADLGDPVVARIVTAALVEFERSGIRRGVVERIARDAGVGRATVYRRFPDKSALVRAVLDRKLADQLAELGAVMAAVPDPTDRLVEGFVTMLRLLREDRLLQRMIAVEPDVVLPLLTVHGGPGIAVAREFLADQLRAIPGGLPRSLDPDHAAEIAVRLVHSLLATPEGLIAQDEQGSRELAERYLAPALFTASPARG